MLRIKVKEKDNIDRAIKEFKRKFNMHGTLKEIREREQFTKPSVKKRIQKKKAIYIQKLRQSEDL